MILYLHGFRSSPASLKARLLAEKMKALGRSDDFCCPQLPISPKVAFALAHDQVRDQTPDTLCVIGSSLGGFYATALAEKLGCRAVLLNPAVTAALNLAKYIGPTTGFHDGAPLDFKPEYIAELRAFEVEKITRPERYFLIAATGDEVLNWRDMVAHYQGAQQTIVEGSDHALSDFDRHMDAVLAFAGVHS